MRRNYFFLLACCRWRAAHGLSAAASPSPVSAFCCAEEGGDAACWSSMSAREWLGLAPPSVYTVMRCSGRRVVGWDLHLARLEASDAAAASRRDLERRVARLASECCAQLAGSGLSLEDDEATLCVALDARGRLRARASRAAPTELALPAARDLEIAPRSGPRRRPEVKHSSWCVERVPLERTAAESRRLRGVCEEVFEVALVGVNDELLEGLTSNLFALTKGGVVRTAPRELVLPGVARALALEACAQLGLRVCLDAPTWAAAADDDDWAEVWLTNANLFLAPVGAVHDPRRKDVLFEAADHTVGAAVRGEMLRLARTDKWAPIVLADNSPT